MQTSQQIDREFCSGLATALAHGEPVDYDLPGDSHLHVDRQLPFLCVYRRPAAYVDAGTEQLVTSQSSYLILSEQTQADANLSRLVETIARVQGENFGGFLLLELWTPADDKERLFNLSLRIVATSSHTSAALLEAMESALLRVRIGELQPLIELDYRETVAPPNMAPLLDETQCAAIACTSVGLEINPVFRDSKTGKLDVFAYREFRHRINRALKRSFYTFTHECTSHRPPHWHALGPRTIEQPVRLVDEALAEIGSEFDLLLFVSPINSAAAWKRFSQHRFQEEVEFLYRPRTIDPALLKRRLYEVPIESIDDPTLSYIFEAKRDELDRQLTLLGDRNTPAFLLGSRQLFGDVHPALLQLADSLLSDIAPATASTAESGMLDAQAFSIIAQQELDFYRAQDPSLSSRIEIRDDIPGIMVSHGNLLIGSGATISKSRLQASVAHEIGTHVLTYHNGRQQPLQELSDGMAGYETLQEGLAVLSEYLVGELGTERLRQVAGRAIAAHLIVEGADFIETYRHLNAERGFNPYAAFTMTMRTYRGGGYTKDGIYLQGLVDLLAYLAKGKDLQTLYLGKIAKQFIPVIEELRWRNVLHEPSLRPRLFSMPESQDRLKRLAQGMQVIDLIEESS